LTTETLAGQLPINQAQGSKAYLHEATIFIKCLKDLSDHS